MKLTHWPSLPPGLHPSKIMNEKGRRHEEDDDKEDRDLPVDVENDAEAAEEEQKAGTVDGQFRRRHFFAGRIADQHRSVLEMIEARIGEIEPENDATDQSDQAERRYSDTWWIN